MIRGINQSQLFYDDADRRVFLNRMIQFRDEIGGSLLAYALMDNHVHLLFRASKGQLALFAKKVQLSYSHWFNRKYERNGYLFQGRYKSEPVETNEYLLAAIRYIHQNPVKIGKPPDYWTSYHAYAQNTTRSSLTDTALVLSILGDTPEQARTGFKELVAQQTDDGVSSFDRQAPRHIGDDMAQVFIRQLGDISHCQDVCNLPKEQRDAVFAGLARKGCSVRQIARLTGVNRGIVHKAWKNAGARRG
jgi:REP element-mobilizing transposase RayT